MRFSPSKSTSLDVWEIGSAPSGVVDHPDALARESMRWVAGRAPGTVASALRAAGEWELGNARSFDANDWWYRCRFESAASSARRIAMLELGGLATIADVWLNGEHLLRSENMFHEHAIDVSGRVRSTNELAIRFSSLKALMAAKRPRPRFKTALVDDQSLRWFRTALVGRIPAWTPPVEAVGPWREIALHEDQTMLIEDADLRAYVDGSSGVVRINLRVRVVGESPSVPVLRVGDAQTPLTCRAIGDRLFALEGELRISDIALWWPRSHGAQPLYPVSIHLRLGGSEHVASFNAVGFRKIDVERDDGGFAIRVNDVPIFCRGACWTTLDIARMGADADAYDTALDAAADAGMNMLRVPGTMHYEHDAFYAGCDERGILVWQDFMFANLDYPAENEAFCTSVAREASQLLSRLQLRPSVAVLCGNSEVAQQAAMLGLPRELWTNALFEQTLPAIVRDIRPDVVYLPSTPSGGVLPFHVDSGVSHYYGVGAYLRPLEDARRAGVRFTSECLGFSNVPCERTIDLVLSARQAPFVHPAWKSRVPRDSGAGWDFEDVRDHYLERLFGVDPMSMRQTDMERYLALSRVVTGEVMASALSEWRRGGSKCAGALVWFFRDLWPGAGWGLIDSTGTPKAAYYFVRRTMQPVALLMTDEGLNGLSLHAINDTAANIDVDLELALFRHGDTRVALGSRPLTLGARSVVTIGSDTLLEHFLDVTYAYRFGAHGRDVAVGTLRKRGDGAPIGTAFHFPMGHAFARERDIGLEASARSTGEGTYALTVRTKQFAQSVSIDAIGFQPDDDYFHLAPGSERTIALRPLGSASALRGALQALNALTPTKIVLVAPDGDRASP
jgi:beta-mannosidase